MMPLSIDLSLVRAWAIQFNRAHREASINASMWRLRFAAAFIFGALVFLAGRALAETNADAPTGKADAVIDLATKEGVDLVKVGGVIATPKSSTSISRRLAPTNNRQVNQTRLTISRRTPASQI